MKKQSLFAVEGKINHEIGFLLEGNMRHYYTKDEEEKTTYFYFEDHFVAAYIDCLTGQPSRLSIQALTDCRLLVFPYQTLLQLFEKSQAWNSFGRRLAEYLAIGLETRMVGLLLQSPEERYRELLQGNKQKIIERIPQFSNSKKRLSWQLRWLDFLFCPFTLAGTFGSDFFFCPTSA